MPTATASPKRKQKEDKVLTVDVQAILRRLVRPDSPNEGESVALIAERADTSTRTVYRILACSTETISLDLADRVCLAADAHVSECRFIDSEGNITTY